VAPQPISGDKTTVDQEIIPGMYKALADHFTYDPLKEQHKLYETDFNKSETIQGPSFMPHGTEYSSYMAWKTGIDTGIAEQRAKAQYPAESKEGTNAVPTVTLPDKINEEEKAQIEVEQPSQTPVSPKEPIQVAERRSDTAMGISGGDSHHDQKDLQELALSAKNVNFTGQVIINSPYPVLNLA